MKVSLMTKFWSVRVGGHPWGLTRDHLTPRRKYFHSSNEYMELVKSNK